MVNQVPVNTIEITEKAANKVKLFAQQDGKVNFALRVAVKGGGCSGLLMILILLIARLLMMKKLLFSMKLK